MGRSVGVNHAQAGLTPSGDFTRVIFVAGATGAIGRVLCRLLIDDGWPVGAPGIYNVAEDDGVVASAKARRELGWSDGFRAADRVV